LPALNDVMEKIDQGRYAIPEIQRPYVWRNRQVLELFNSIRQNLPIGSILIWDMPRELVENYGDLLRPLVDELEDRRKNFQYMVIDGQQRLVSIYLARKGFVKIGGRERSIALYFNPTLDDEGQLKLARGKVLERDPYWFKVSDILTAEAISDVLERKAKMSGDESITKNTVISKGLEKFRNTVLNYPVNIYLVPENALRYDGHSDNFPEILEKISEMFVRLNSTGTRIKMTHLVTAILTAKTRRNIGESFRKKLREIDEYFDNYYEGKWDISEPVLMRAYMAVATSTTRFKEARSKLEAMNSRKIIEYLECTRGSLKNAIDVLIRELNIKEVKFLKSKYSLVTLTYYLFKRPTITPEDIRFIRRWLLLSSFDRRYTGRLESDLGEDIKLISEGRSLKDLESQLTTREITESLLDNVYDNEHLIALLMLLKDGYDLKAGKEIRKIRDLEEIHIHHIFPKDLLRKVYGEKVGNIDVETAYDLVGNITIVSKEANEIIGSKRPDEYLKDFSEEMLRSHYIPTEPELWKPENYEGFIMQRKELLFRGINNITRA